MSHTPSRPSFWGAVWAGLAVTPAPWVRQPAPMKKYAGYRAADMAGPHVDFRCDVTFYPVDQGGRRNPVRGDMHRWFDCSCKASPEDAQAWEGRFLLEGEIIKPGGHRRLGVMFQSNREAIEIVAALGRFYLWEGRVIGEAVVVEGP